MALPAWLARFLLLSAAWALAGLLLCWARLPGPWRRAAALVTSAAGLVFLFFALSAAGERETATTGAFLLGAPYVTGKAQASASLPYYVMTGVCLLLGTAGLAVPTLKARRLADHWMATAIGLSILITLVRFLLEQAAAPEAWIWIAGITALTPVVGAFFAWCLWGTPRPLRRLVISLLVYGVSVRGWVAALYVFSTALHLGSHYDLSQVVQVRNPLDGSLHVYAPRSFTQVLALVIMPQLLFWPLFTLVAGLLGAALFYLATWGSGLDPVRRASGGPALGSTPS